MDHLNFIFYYNDRFLKKISFRGNDNTTVSIGRSDTDITIPADDLSRIHAQLIYDGSQVYVIDCNSANGTFVNGRRLTNQQPVSLKKNDEVFFGVQCKLLVRPASDTAPNDSLQNRETIAFRLNEKKEIRIGRGSDCDIVLPHQSVSRLHAIITKDAAGHYTIIDNSSLNGVFVNGKKVKKAGIGANDKLYIGRFELSLDGEQRDLHNESAIRADYVTKKYKNGYKALQETTFDLPAGGVIAIMGPSGCGKSTLLKILNGTIPPSTGNVYIHGLDLFDNFSYLKTQIGYVPQDDILHTALTVRQSIYYAAKIRLNGVADEIITNKTEKLLKKLNIKGISEHLISDISGGQRKRVSIAIELLSDPAILFLDEPTSPLDPQIIAEFMTILQSLSASGTTVIMVTHKPEDLNYMDKVIFMAEGGAMAFYGNAGAYKTYFEVENPVDVYVNISGEKARQWVQRFAKSVADQAKLPTAPHKRKNDKTDPFTQFYWLISRYFKIKLNDQKNTAIMLLQAPVIALLLCLVFKEIKLAVLFLTTVSAIWFGVNNAAREIVSEAAIYKRERMFNLMIFPYVFSKALVLAFFALIQSAIFISIITLAYNNDPVKWEHWGMGVGWMFFLTFCSSLLGLFISAANDNTEKAMSVVPIIIIPQIMLAGVVTIIPNSLVELLSYFTISRWGTEGFTHIQSKTMETFPTPKGIPEKQQMESFDFMKNQLHDTYDLAFGDHAGTFHLNITVLIIMSLFCLAGIWIFLIKKDRSQL
jgi:ABC-type multidrug transport system ATPase subunit/pSer/pThr/pTyr-binding forkhead associated (FHA) protein/ABC-type multidrug transport system permease subunit